MQVVMQAIKEQTKERGAERAALTNTHLLNSGLSSRASHLHRQSPTGIQRPDGRQHAGAHPNGLQSVPQKMILDGVIGLEEVHKAYKGRLEMRAVSMKWRKAKR